MKAAQIFTSMIIRSLLVVCGLAFASFVSIQGQINHKDFKVKTPDGLTISAQEWGNPNGKEIIFIHGLSQSYLSWIKQLDGGLAKEFRIITYDLRGHGNSDKPLEAKFYDNGKVWADDLNAVMEAAMVKRPILVGWSYGGTIILDYVKVYGTKKLAGINFVDSALKFEPATAGKASPWLELMVSEDLAKNIEGTRNFLRNCFYKQPSQDEFEKMLAFNMLAPPFVRSAMVKRSFDYDAAAREIKLPVLVTHGTLDEAIKFAAAKYTVSIIPNARLSEYQDTGHSPFYEASERFNTELTEFTRKQK